MIAALSGRHVVNTIRRKMQIPIQQSRFTVCLGNSGTDDVSMLVAVTTEKVFMKGAIYPLRQNEPPAPIYVRDFSHRSTLQSLSNAVSVAGS
jgi:hypothetical protein